MDDHYEYVMRLLREEERDNEKKKRKIRLEATKIRTAIFERDGYKCKQCGKDGSFYPTELEVDHILPVSKGGTSEPENLQTLCQRCNRKKNARVC